MGDRYGRSDIIEISIGISIWDMGYRFGIQCIDVVIYHIDMVILDIDMGYEANDIGDDSIDTVISHIDMGYLVTLVHRPWQRTCPHDCLPCQCTSNAECACTLEQIQANGCRYPGLSPVSVHLTVCSLFAHSVSVCAYTATATNSPNT